MRFCAALYKVNTIAKASAHTHLATQPLTYNFPPAHIGKRAALLEVLG
jgi:hypothetical protein